jgi:hypothetical protein
MFRCLFRPSAIPLRILVKMRHLCRLVPLPQYSWQEQGLILWRLPRLGITESV